MYWSIGFLKCFVTLFSLFCGLYTVQGISNYGTEFNIGFIPASDSNTLSLLIQAQFDNTSITVRALNGFQYEGVIANRGPFSVGGSFQTVEGSGFNFRQLGFKIVSSFPVSIIGLSSNQNDTVLLSFLALPYIRYSAINEYIYYGISSLPSDTSYSTLLLVGNRDDTNITIIPTFNITLPSNVQSNDSMNITIQRGQSYTVTLHSLQTLLIVSYEGDLTGTKIIATKPLTVIGGQDCIEGTLLEECNPLATQISPTITWGSRFLLPTSIDNKFQYTVISSEPNTVITCQGRNTTRSQLLSLAGEKWSFVVNSTHYCGLLDCNQRCYVAMFSLTEVNSTLSNVISILPIIQYTNITTITPLSTNSYYTVIIPYNRNLNRTLLINGVPNAPNWSPIYNTNGTISGYVFNDNFNTSITISRPTMGPLFTTVYNSEGTYGHTASTLLTPLFPRVMISPRDSCILEGSDWTIVSLIRLSDFDISFNLGLISPSTNSTVVEFLSGEQQKVVNISLDTGMDTIELSAVVDSENDSRITLAQTVLTVQETEGITVGFTEDRSVFRTDELSLEVQLGGSELRCLTDDGNIVLLLQLIDEQSNVVNVTQIQFNQYLTTYNVQIKLPLVFNEVTMISARLILLSNSGINIGMEQSQIMLTLMSPTSSTIITTLLPTQTTTLLPTPTRTVDSVVTTLLNPATAYTIGISSTLLTGVICLFVALGAFGCGKFCPRRQKHESFDMHNEGLPERPGHYNVINKPYNLTNVPTTHVISDGGFANRNRADSQRRPPPLPPASRPLPLLPHESEVHVNMHNDEHEEALI